MSSRVWGLIGLCVVVILIGIAPMSTAGDAKATVNSVNEIAICGCGKAFVTSAATEYLTVGGKSYACCTHECHEMALKDPAAAGRMADDLMARTLAQLNHLNLGVGNVIAVTEDGTQAVCGCGKKFMVDRNTEYLNYQGKSYACCTHECHAMASKDVPGAVKSAQAQMAKM